MNIFRKLIFLFCFGLFIFPGKQNHSYASSLIKRSVVKIYTVSSGYNYYQPWQKRAQQERSGSGCIISGNRILTNAHVVGNHTFIQVKRSGQAKKYVARVVNVAHQCDLAIIEVNDKNFFKGTKPIGISNLPEIRDKVAVYGFPKGGDELSITEGVVSRIEHVNYSHSNAYLLSCQIDAAINSGNSGGPVIKDSKIVGVAFQSFTSGENIGYMIPAPIVSHFLNDIKDGKYEGIPELGISLQNLDNPDIREKFGLSEKQSGVLINKIDYNSPVRGILKKDDVVLNIEEINIANDGTIEFRPGERTFFGYIVQGKFINDKISMKILRNKKLLTKTIKLTRQIDSERLVPYEQYDLAPTYYINGGLVFEPLTKNFLKEWGGEWYNKAPIALLNLYYNGVRNKKFTHVVVLVKVLADEINVGYHGWGSMVIVKVNNRTITSILDIVKAFEKNKGDFHVIEDLYGYRIILSRDKVEKFSSRILNRYNIKTDRSVDLIKKN